MSLKPLTDSKCKSIVRNVLAACKNITKLNNQGYGYIHLASGFIAHYNLGGFIAHYQTHSLRDDILANASSNKWSNFRPGDRDYEYYHQQGKIYADIVAGLQQEKT